MIADRLSDPFAPGFTDDPYAVYALLREEAPVYRHPLGFWVLTRYEDVSWVLRADLSVEMRNVIDSRLTPLREKDGELSPYTRVSGLPMVDRDPPDHTRLRRLVTKAFTPRAVQAFRPRISTLVDGMLDEVAKEGTADLVNALAFPLPFTVIADMLGTPPADHVRIRELTGMMVMALEPIIDPAIVETIAAANEELTGIAAGMIAWKRKNPARDVLTALIEAEDEGDLLDDDELIAQVLMLYVGGHETTVNLVGGGTAALLRNPDQLARLRQDPELVGNTVEELLRYESPVQIGRRITLQPVTVEDITIPQGAYVLASLASANRDEEFWGPDADTLRLDRDTARRHVSFGAGPHHCLGASLARLEASIAFDRLITRFPNLRLDGEVTWNDRINLRGPTRLPVAVS